jgi:4-hydroxybenzoate polyprenyltransferase/phosphoserine phosphatase
LNSSKSSSTAGTISDAHLERPLVVDLDGTLIHTDTLHELALQLLRDKPYLVLLLPFWLLNGKAALKKKLASVVQIDITSLPFNAQLIEWLALQKKIGRRLVLCTATDRSIAKPIADQLNLFDEVIASNGNENIAGENKARVLEARFGSKGFDYVGNSSADLAVWARAKQGVVVNASNHVATQARKLTEIVHLMPRKAKSQKTWIKTFRIHQWIKNLLIFVPVLAAHEIITRQSGLYLLLAFLSFSLCASALYIANDLFDLTSDRLHPHKRHRPFACGEVPVWQGIVLAPLLIFGSFFVASYVGGNFLPWLAVYFGLTCAYSWGFKRLVLIDCFILAILYTLRIVAGAAAVNIPLSFWLLALSIFLFLSLAFIKRYAELQLHLASNVQKVSGRGYRLTDTSLVQQLGVTSGYAAVLVLALYLNSENILRLYRAPEMIWGAVPLLLLWISWMWLNAYRGLMHDDPIVFAIKDKTSIFIGALLIGVFILASLW